MEYNNIRLNKTIANKIGAFKPSEFAKKGVKVGDYLISCHFGDVILLTAEKMKNLIQWETKGVYYVKPTKQNIDQVRAKYKLQQTIDKLRDQREKLIEDEKKLAKQIQGSFGKETTSDIVLFIHVDRENKRQLKVKDVPVLEGHELLNFGIRYDHRKQPHGGEALYIALIRITGLTSKQNLAQYGGLVNKIFDSKRSGFGYAKDIQDTGYKPGEKFVDGMTTVIK